MSEIHKMNHQIGYKVTRLLAYLQYTRTNEVIMKTNFLQVFFNHLQQQAIISPKDKLLVAISGGLDSMVLGHLLLDLGYDFDVVHVNFHLRGKESDGDATFVKNFAEAHDLVYHQLDVDTDTYAKKHKISIQEAARQLRYQWFEEKRQAIQAQWILVAHQKNDIAETMIFNLTRGAGIAGLHGIKAQNGFIVRPLLFAARQQILAYAKENDVDWREDSSNEKTKYARNLIRHEVMPLLETINPAVISNLVHNAQIMSELEVVLNEYVQMAKETFVKTDTNEVRIHLEPIRQLASAKTVLYYLLKDDGFNETLVKDILDAEESSKVFLSSKKRAVIHGEYLLITDFAEDVGRTYSLEARSDVPIDTPEFKMSWTKKDYHGQNLPDDDETVWLNSDRLVFPLILRKRKAGDRFQPIGMGGKSKKIKDYLSSLKLSLPAKEKVWILESGDGTICWVVGYRLDERYKVFGGTKEILEIKLVEK